MTWIAWMLGAGLIIGAAYIRRMRRTHAWRWNPVPAAAVMAGQGHFRKAALDRARGVPVLVTAAAASSMAWGLVTGVVFVPAGLILALIALGQNPLLGFLLAAVSLHGLVLAFRLSAAARWLIRREDEPAVRVAHASLAHHALVIAVFALFTALPDDRSFGLFGMAAVPSLLGLGQAALLWRAASPNPRLRQPGSCLPPRAPLTRAP